MARYLRDRSPLIYALLSLLLIYVVWQNAWLSDDIFITFRYLFNLREGHGLVWNISERVESFTHPAWLWLLYPFYMLTGKAWLTAWLVSLLCLGGVLVVLYRNAPDLKRAVAMVLLLLASRSFIDFSTGGLENPLSHLLLVALGAIWWGNSGPRRVLWLALLGACLVLTRLDLLLVVLPLGLDEWRRLRSNFTWRQALLGLAPLIIWKVAAFIYYGFLLPNTFYAKASTGFPRSWLLEQGMAYFGNVLQADPVLLPLVLLAVGLAIWSGRSKMVAWAIGIGLYLFYILWVGGDFMSGRFFSVPYVAAVLLLGQIQLPDKYLLAGSVAILFLALFHPYHPLKTDSNYYNDRRGKERNLYEDGIVDEKGMAWARSHVAAIGHSEIFSIEKEMKDWGAHPGAIVQYEQLVAVGFAGYRKGPAVHIIDELALTDPLLARLPALRVWYWRIGHFFRRIPVGYMEHVQQAEAEWADVDLAEYSQRLELVTRGSIWSGERWREMGRFLLGRNQQLIDSERYATPTESEATRFE